MRELRELPPNPRRERPCASRRPVSCTACGCLQAWPRDERQGCSRGAGRPSVQATATKPTHSATYPTKPDPRSIDGVTRVAPSRPICYHAPRQQALTVAQPVRVYINAVLSNRFARGDIAPGASREPLPLPCPTSPHIVPSRLLRRLGFASKAEHRGLSTTERSGEERFASGVARGRLYRPHWPGMPPMPMPGWPMPG